MNENLEAELFNKELDKILAGKAVAADLDPELAADLAFAAKLARLDLSAESKAKRTAKTRILERAAEGRLRGLLRRAGVRPLVLAGAVAALAIALLIPSFFNEHQAKREVQVAQNSNMFGSGASPYDAGGYAAGGAIGGAGDAITPSAASDPSSLITGFDGNAGRGKSGALSGKGFNRAGRGGGAVAATRGNALGYLSGAAAPGSAMPEMQYQPLDREGYAHTPENVFQKVSDHPLSTFSIDVDAASYANTRRFLNQGSLPPVDAVRLEEMINYFKYEYPEPEGEHPFSITTELAACPWNAAHKLVRVGIKGKSIPVKDLPANNLVFLIDTSGSMMSPDKLPLLKKGLTLLVEQLRKQDKVSIVAYAGSAGLVLPPTSGSRKGDILAAIENLQAGGSTAGGAGIALAYQTAQGHFLKNGNNRVVLATDGDFNVGVTSDGELTRMIEEKREKGVFLTVLGFGTGNYQDAKMEQLADKGNGNYAYIDDIMEAQKVLVKEMGGTLLTIAKDVKIQVEFNPARAAAYKLIGYENRMLKKEDFNDDKKDAGELGAGHTVTALYEVIPAGVKSADLPSVDELKYQAQPAATPAANDSKELLTVKFRYKKPKEDKSLLLTRPLLDETKAWSAASPDFQFAASVAGFGMLLRQSPQAKALSYAGVREMAQAGLSRDEDGYRAELIQLIKKAELLDKRAGSPAPER